MRTYPIHITDTNGEEFLVELVNSRLEVRGQLTSERAAELMWQGAVSNPKQWQAGYAAFLDMLRTKSLSKDAP